VRKRRTSDMARKQTQIPDQEPGREHVNVVKVGERRARWPDSEGLDELDATIVVPLYRIVEADEPLSVRRAAGVI
jgi:hypothetical protein